MRFSSWSAGAHEGVLFQNTGPFGLRQKEQAADKTSDKEGAPKVGQIRKFKRGGKRKYLLRAPQLGPQAQHKIVHYRMPVPRAPQALLNATTTPRLPREASAIFPRASRYYRSVFWDP